jgi:hypothetical protein
MINEEKLREIMSLESISESLKIIAKQMEIQNMINLTKWSLKLDGLGYEESLSLGRDNRIAVNEEIQFFQSFFQSYEKAHKSFMKIKQEQWEKNNLKEITKK